MDTAELKQMFNGSEDIIHVSNKENFEETLEKSDELFVDYAHGNFVSWH